MKVNDIPKFATCVVFFESGLGDVLLNYKRRTAATSYVIPLTMARRDLRFRAVVCSHNENAVTVFDRHPWFHEVVNIPYRQGQLESVRRENSQGCIDLQHICESMEDVKPIRMPFYLNEEDNERLALMMRTPYVLVHPWSSAPSHSWYVRIGSAGMDRVVKTILDCGFAVAVTGKPYRKNETGRDEWKEEGYQCPNFAPQDRFHDLMGSSVILTAEAVQRASCVVGALSAFTSLAGELVRPCWLGISESMRGDFAREGDIFQRYVLQGASLNWWTRRDTLESELVTLKTFLEKYRS